ncbi:MAG: hypothetical protein GX049_15005 [Alcaligenaceae bacterium]|nr:hypothetical protein [Alcaligenaceae bacterium]
MQSVDLIRSVGLGWQGGVLERAVVSGRNGGEGASLFERGAAGRRLDEPCESWTRSIAP